MKNFFKNLVLASVVLSTSFLNAHTLKVGTNANFPPFEFVDENSKITGFDIDLIDAISKKVGFEYEIVNMGFDGLIPALKSGKIDIIASSMSATEERKKAVDFTDAYYITENAFIKRKADLSIKTKDDTKGKAFGVQLGTIQEWAVDKIKDAKKITMKNPIGVVMALKNSKLDVVILDLSVANGYVRENSDLEIFHIEPDGSDGSSFALDKDKHTELVTKFNNAIKELKVDGTYDKLLEKYNLK
ncbi:basic amino acid ABC transporter substrate-binding protein [Campylobacter sp. FMV-PI01]|uniref:Basic amino acid ABC transporter substrate-binding protein n=1 Tax=Campylobacter portucalensis TaxID=2608384 RepID=A0A6L5WHP7_9BACT|nr:basic amino acid ABC transporter substrate-binding protein [Campylobacter portucalensis]MSN96619.1 basic amino acid ABC transporter substrate-binding protein [Campylobacter portucalensis]